MYLSEFSTNERHYFELKPSSISRLNTVSCLKNERTWSEQIKESSNTPSASNTSAASEGGREGGSEGAPQPRLVMGPQMPDERIGAIIAEVQLQRQNSSVTARGQTSKRLRCDWTFHRLDLPAKGELLIRERPVVTHLERPVARE